MEHIHNFLVRLDTYIGGHPWFVILLLGTGIFFTLYKPNLLGWYYFWQVVEHPLYIFQIPNPFTRSICMRSALSEGGRILVSTHLKE